MPWLGLVVSIRRSGLSGSTVTDRSLH